MSTRAILARVELVGIARTSGDQNQRRVFKSIIFPSSTTVFQ